MANMADITWEIGREGRAWNEAEVESRYLAEIAFWKLELHRGKLFFTDEQRLIMLGALLENMGADAAVHLGNPEVWRAALASLDDVPLP
jgi:hypothetical protein